MVLRWRGAARRTAGPSSGPPAGAAPRPRLLPTAQPRDSGCSPRRSREAAVGLTTRAPAGAKIAPGGYRAPRPSWATAAGPSPTGGTREPMRTATTAAQMLVRVTGLTQIVLGVLLWTCTATQVRSL